MNFSNYKTTPTIIAIGVLWTFFSWLLSGLWVNGWLQGIGPGALVGLVFYFYDRCLWDRPLLSLLNKIPNLKGEYEGAITYFREGEQQSKPFVLRIRQTCSTLKVTTIFGDSPENQTESTSTHAYIEEDASGEHELVFLYRNDGSQMAGDTLNCHNGTNILQIQQEGKSRTLTGHYYTDRSPQTKGKMRASKIS